MPKPIRLSFFVNFVTNYNNFHRFSKEIATFLYGRVFGVKIEQSHVLYMHLATALALAQYSTIQKKLLLSIPSQQMKKWKKN